MADFTIIQSQTLTDDDDDDNDLININDQQHVSYSFDINPIFVPSYSHELGSETVYPDYDNDEYDQMDFITDLFEPRRDTEHVSSRFSVNNDGEELELGLRVTRIESESDIEELGGLDNDNDVWECPYFDRERGEREGEEGLSLVIDRIEEISVLSEITSEGDAAVGALEWEILLAVNNLERDLEFETDGNGEGFVYTPEFDTLIGQFVETVRALRGSPPAAKSFVDELPLVELEKGGGDDGDCVICAICKDEILLEEKVMQLPCRHHYHGECIVPWLSIRNTCPVCRFELPTDDVDYERSKNRVDVNDDELRVGYGFEP